MEKMPRNVEFNVMFTNMMNNITGTLMKFIGEKCH